MFSNTGQAIRNDCCANPACTSIQLSVHVREKKLSWQPLRPGAEIKGEVKRGENGGWRCVSSCQAESSPTLSSIFWSKGRLLPDNSAGSVLQGNFKRSGPFELLAASFASGLGRLLAHHLFWWIQGFFLGEKNKESHHMSEARPGCSTSQQDGNHSKRAALPPVYGNMFYGNMTAEINLSEVGGITIRNSTQGGGKHLSEKAPTQTPSIRQFSWRGKYSRCHGNWKLVHVLMVGETERVDEGRK